VILLLNYREGEAREKRGKEAGWGWVDYFEVGVGSVRSPIRSLWEGRLVIGMVTSLRNSLKVQK